MYVAESMHAIQASMYNTVYCISLHKLDDQHNNASCQIKLSYHENDSVLRAILYFLPISVSCFSTAGAPPQYSIPHVERTASSWCLQNLIAFLVSSPFSQGLCLSIDSKLKRRPLPSAAATVRFLVKASFSKYFSRVIGSFSSPNFLIMLRKSAAVWPAPL